MQLSSDKLLTGLRARYRASPMPAFLGWWWGELRSLVPGGLRQRLVASRPQLIVMRHGGHGLEAWRGGAAPEQLAVWEDLGDQQTIRSRLLEIMGSYDDGKPEIRLCLRDEDVLECNIQLPMAVEGNLAQALTYQLDQFTPFRADQVWYDYRVTRRDSKHGKLDVTVRLVPRAALDRLLEQLAVLSLRPHALDVVATDQDPQPMGYNLIPEHQRPSYVHRRARINLMLGVAALGLLALVMAQSLLVRERGMEQLREEADRARSEARMVMDLRQELDDALQAANFLADRRARQPVMIEVLSELTRIMPTEIWLQQMRVVGRELNIQGYADAAERVIALVNDSPLLEDAEFRTQVQIDPTSGKERFNAHAQVITSIRETSNEDSAGP